MLYSYRLFSVLTIPDWGGTWSHFIPAFAGTSALLCLTPSLPPQPKKTNSLFLGRMKAEDGWEDVSETNMLCVLLPEETSSLKSLKQAWSFDGALFMRRANYMRKGQQAAVGELQSQLFRQMEEMALGYQGFKDNWHFRAIRVSTFNARLPLLSQTRVAGMVCFYLASIVMFEFARFIIFCFQWLTTSWKQVSLVLKFPILWIIQKTLFL